MTYEISKLLPQFIIPPSHQIYRSHQMENVDLLQFPQDLKINESNPYYDHSQRGATYIDIDPIVIDEDSTTYLNDGALCAHRIRVKQSGVRLLKVYIKRDKNAEDGKVDKIARVTPPKNKPNSLGKNNKKILLTWLAENEENPYPTQTEVNELIERTGLSCKQIKTFMVNYRMRFLKRNPKDGKVNQGMNVLSSNSSQN